MSTTSLRAALTRLAAKDGGALPDTLSAIRELEAIERAAKDWRETEGQLGPGRMRRLGVLLEAIAKDAP